ncbi:peptidase S41 [Brevundimonas sp.]|uniref:peptidase S41 n=2 Tax=Brevundimonas sp. TaxID=1871086 RepID=UPI0027ECC2FF|nr:peptidase S41 [Brevundimonas sp.]MDQ7813285.1 peptidase S41 [Brevundimonas sp.]
MNTTAAALALVAALAGAGPALAQETPPPVAAPADWGQALREDARAFHDLIADSHPGPVDPENPGFRALLDGGLRTALTRAETAQTYEDWHFALQAYSASFDDGHLGLSEFAPMGHEWRRRWPGFLTTLRGDRVEIAFSQGGERPPAGARLISCDGRDADALAAELLGQGAGRWSLRSRRVAVSASLFVDYHDPYVTLPQTCVFETDGQQRTWSLAWAPLTDEEVDEAFAAASPRRHVTGVGLRAIDGGYWIEMGSFDPDASSEQGIQLTALHEQVVASADAIRAADVVVFDLRGNNGGSSTWSTEIAKALWGAAWIDDRVKGSEGVDWRASPANLAAVVEYQRMFADNPDLADYFDRMVTGLGAAVERGDALWRQPDFSDGDEAAAAQAGPPTTAMRARTWVLTDYGCASACLDAVDVLTAAGATVIGQETSADTVYMEVRRQALPSGRAQTHLPMKVYRGRARGNNETVVPAHVWTGDMSDTAGLEAWVAQLDPAATSR